jgi:hypothetical protein
MRDDVDWIPPESHIMPARKDAAARLRRAGIVALIFGGTFALPTMEIRARTTAQLSKDSRNRPSLIITPDREFAASSYVHEQLRPTVPRDARSDAWLADLQRQIRSHYGVASVNIDQYSPPLFVVAIERPTVRVRAERADDPAWTFEPLQQQWKNVPLPDGLDKEAIVYQPSTGRYWKFWGMERSGRKVVDSAGRRVDEWRAAWGGRIDDLGRNPGYFPTTPEGYKFGTAATGFALLAGLITIAEQRQGTIDHAIHVALPLTRRSVWVPPAQQTDGEESGPNAIPQGTTFRFPESVNLDQIDMDPYARMIARAVQKHGMVVRDTVGTWSRMPKLAVERSRSSLFGAGGILRCVKGRAQAACYADGNNRLGGFPWDKLEAIQATLQE